MFYWAQSETRLTWCFACCRSTRVLMGPPHSVAQGTQGLPIMLTVDPAAMLSVTANQRTLW